MKKNITLEELILEFQPFSDQLITWCKKYPEFMNALKNVHPGKFISPSVIMLTYPPCGDEVIGVYSYHYQLKTPVFKQDFIVNLGFGHSTYILYTRNPAGFSNFVKDISVFFDKYGKYGYKKEDHHLTYNELPEVIKERAYDTINLAKKIKDIDLNNITQQQINKLYAEVREIKSKTDTRDVFKF